MVTFEFTNQEVMALVDALKKGASRHESYAKFYGASRRVEHHELMAGVMRGMLLDVEKKAQRIWR